MSRSVTLDGVDYTLPTSNDVDWGRNFDLWAQAVSARAEEGGAGGGAGAATGVIDANEEFSIVADAADSSAGFLAMRTYLRANPYSIVKLQPGLYNINSCRWLEGVVAATILGRGTQIRQILDWNAGGTGNDGDGTALYLNPNYFYDTNGLPLASGGTATYVESQEIETAEIGDESVTFLDPADITVGRFEVGGNIMILGWLQQVGGYPPNARYKEIRKITAINLGTGVVTFDEPLLNYYDERWYDDGARVGKARALSLNRTGGFQLAEYIELVGIEFLDCSTEENNVDESRGHGSIRLHGARKVVLRDIIGGVVTPCESEDFIAIGCKFAYVEVDKLMGRAIFDHCKIDKLTGATGCDDLVVRDTPIFTEVSLHARKTLFDNVAFYCKPTCDLGIIEYRRVEFYNRVAGTEFVQGAQNVRTLEACTAVTANSITLPRDLTAPELQYIAIGTRIYVGAIGDATTVADNSNWAIVSNVYQSGTDMIIEGAFKKAPTIGEVYLYRPTLALHLDGYDPINGEAASISFPERVTFTPNVAHMARRRSVVVQFPIDADEVTVSLNGYLDSIKVVVVGVAVHPGPGYVLLNLYPSSVSSMNRAVDTTVLGTREITALAATSGGPTSPDDSISAHDGRYVRDYNLNIAGQFATPPTTYARGFVVFNVIDHA